MKNQREIRTLQLDRVTLREDSGAFFGHAAVFNTLTDIGEPPSWGFREQIHPKAFDRAIKEGQDVRLFLNHNPDHVLARTAAGTMTLRTDSKGLVVEADLADTSVGRDVQISLARGDLSQMSFGFIVRGEEWKSKDGVDIRTITDVDLFDVSVVSMPAYASTDASLRSIVEATHNELALQRQAAARARFELLMKNV